MWKPTRTLYYTVATMALSFEFCLLVDNRDADSPTIVTASSSWSRGISDSEDAQLLNVGNIFWRALPPVSWFCLHSRARAPSLSPAAAAGPTAGEFPRESTIRAPHRHRESCSFSVRVCVLYKQLASLQVKVWLRETSSGGAEDSIPPHSLEGGRGDNIAVFCSCCRRSLVTRGLSVKGVMGVEKAELYGAGQERQVPISSRAGEDKEVSSKRRWLEQLLSWVDRLSDEAVEWGDAVSPVSQVGLRDLWVSWGDRSGSYWVTLTGGVKSWLELSERERRERKAAVTERECSKNRARFCFSDDLSGVSLCLHTTRLLVEDDATGSELV